jgi:hypothetical protein
MLVRAQARHGFAWEEHDIRDSPVLYERFRYDVPVVSVNGQVALKLRFTEDALESLFS